jgi:Protein of unknown function (DUF3489)
MNVIAAIIAAQGDHTKMKHFTIDAENNLAVHSSKKAAREIGAGVFATEVQLADLIGPDNKRLVAIWNSLPGVQPVTKFANRKVATERIWKAIQGLEEAAAAPSPVQSVAEAPEAALAFEVAAEAISEPATDQTATNTASPEDASESATPQPAPETTQDAVAAEEPLATVGAQAPDVAPPVAPTTKKATVAKKTPKAPKTAKPAKAESGPREGSKTAKVVAMLQRKEGATLTAIMEQMGWQKHTVRGFIAGAMKKAGYTVESFKPEGGERTYRINQ